jgi:hypothetical protein
VARVPAEDRRQVEQQIGNTIYRARDGWFDMPDHHAALHLRSAGYGRSWQVPGVAAPGAGYRCVKCGFRSWFKICGRCKSQCVK